MIFASACLSAEHDTAMATGQEAPWRGMRITRTSWQNDTPPNCAPIPMERESLWTSASISRSRKPWPPVLPDVGKVSRYRVEASLATLSVCSADVPPITIARWYGGHAAVPRERSFASTNVMRLLGFRSDLVSWYR